MGLNGQTDEIGYKNYLRLLLEAPRLVGPVRGVLLQVIEKGEDSLSIKQRDVFKYQIITPFILSSCKSCQDTISWSEMYDAVLEDGLCKKCISTVRGGR